MALTRGSGERLRLHHCRSLRQARSGGPRHGLAGKFRRKYGHGPSLSASLDRRRLCESDGPGYKPLAAAVTFFVGQLFTFAALRKGDVSVATPLLGAKVIFVALLNSIVFGESVGLKWWMAAFICTAGIFLVTGSQKRTDGWTRHSGSTAAYSLIAANRLRPHGHPAPALVGPDRGDQFRGGDVFVHRRSYLRALHSRGRPAGVDFSAPGRQGGFVWRIRFARLAELCRHHGDPVFRRCHGGQHCLQFACVASCWRGPRRDGWAAPGGDLAPKRVAAPPGWGAPSGGSYSHGPGLRSANPLRSRFDSTLRTFPGSSPRKIVS